MEELINDNRFDSFDSNKMKISHEHESNDNYAAL